MNKFKESLGTDPQIGNNFLLDLPFPALELDNQCNLVAANHPWYSFCFQKRINPVSFFSSIRHEDYKTIMTAIQLNKALKREIFLAGHWFQVTLQHNINLSRIFLVDITTLKTRELKAVKRSNLDSLTKLMNRRAFFEEAKPLISTAVKNKAQASLILIDLNRFKWINDNYGHAVGDEVLKISAKRMRQVFRASDLLCRWGGDEFIALLPKSNQRETSLIITRCKTKLEEVIVYDNLRLNMSASVGVASFPKEAQTIKDLLKQADTAMYNDKQAYYVGEFAEPKSGKSNMESEIVDALV